MSDYSEELNREDKLREEYSKKVSELLLGPGSENITTSLENEIISERPEDRYITGILYPQEAETNELEISGAEAGEVDNEFKPSSMGMTLYASSGQNEVLNVNIKTAVYKKENQISFVASDEMVADLNYFFKKYDVLKKSYKITENTITLMEKGKNSGFHEAFDLMINSEVKDKINEKHTLGSMFIRKMAFLRGSLYVRKVQKNNIEIDLNRREERLNENWVLENGEKLNIFTRIQRLDSTDIRAATIILQNKGKHAVFQSQIIIEGNQKGITFSSSEDIRGGKFRNLDEEYVMDEMLYRNKKTYAVGRGISVNWKLNHDRIDNIHTSYIPTHEILPMRFDAEGISSEILKPSTYVCNEKEKSLKLLNEFANSYKKWIDGLKKRIKELPLYFQKYGSDNIKKCEESFNRMQRTIFMLKNDELAFKAFQTANEAILLQRMNGAENKEQVFESRNYSEVPFSWRPFQLAYILNSLESTLDEDSPNRDKLDLIWVSTGGGKTEAYLFSIAAVIAYQRQSNEHNMGVTAIMRYTLRLLTSQQFERATKLICALDFMRQKLDYLGTDPISIGLWIGSSTENRRKNARLKFREMCGSNSYEGAKKINEFQVLQCPWCGAEESMIPSQENYRSMRRWGYKPIVEKGTLEMRCTNPNCPFSSNEGLPIYVVDDDIYQIRPSLLFGTVDKFAQIPLNENAERLLGSSDSAHFKRPSLIIQDEFHLISGPLGSLVGLFETGFDYVFSGGGEGSRPKYVASTATIRNAQVQAKGVFNREVQQFPPNGLEIEDNYFIKENKNSHGRKYFGVMGTGKSQITAEVRLIATLLQVTKDMKISVEDEELFWTVTGYFNSLRELGKASNLITSDVNDQLFSLENRNGIKKRSITSQGVTELTSRVDGKDIPRQIKELEASHAEGKSDVKDVLIATNMLSVGVDIARLNTMFVVGQPKLTSEYIQATSRVGRKTLGSVWTLYNSVKSRDRSHYETFQGYHQNIYKFVEATSVTPFSSPALKKAAASVLVTMLRNTVSDLAADKNPKKIVDHIKDLDKAKEYIMERIKQLPDSELYEKQANKILTDIGNTWINLANSAIDDNNELNYYYHKLKKVDGKTKTILRGFDDTVHPERMDAIPTMETMRTVEETSFLKLIGGNE